MASKIQGIIIEIGGDTSKLQQALKSVDKELSQTQNHLKDVNKLLKLDPTNTDLIKQKFGYLSNAIEQASDKLKTLQEVQAQADQMGVDTSTESYKQLEREIAQINIQLKSFTDQQNDLIVTTREAGIKVSELADAEANLGNSTKKANGLLGQSKGKVGSLISSFTKVSVTVTAVVTALKALYKVVNAVFTQLKESASSAREISKLASQTELSAENLQELSYVAKICNVSLTDITKTIKQNLVAMAEADKLNWDYMEGYQALGVAIYDTNGELRDSGEVYWDVIEALREMEEGTQRDIIAEQLLGRKAADLNEIFALSNEEFNKLIQEAHEVGAVLSEETITALAELNNEIIKAEESYAGFKNLLSLEYSDAFSGLNVAFSNTWSSLIEQIKSGKDVRQLLDAFIEFVPEITQSLKDLLPEILGDVVRAIIVLIPDLIAILLPAIIASIPTIIDAVIDSLPSLMTGIAMAVAQSIPTIIESVVKTVFNLLGDLTGGTMLNLLLAPINSIIDLINSLGSFEIPALELFGQKLWDSKKIKLFEIPRIPMLAKGGILSSGSAIVGEAGPEILTNVGGRSIVQPLTANVNTQQLADAMQCGNQTININFTGSLSQLAKILQPEIERENQRIGTNLLV